MKKYAKKTLKRVKEVINKERNLYNMVVKLSIKEAWIIKDKISSICTELFFSEEARIKNKIMQHLKLYYRNMFQIKGKTNAQKASKLNDSMIIYFLKT